MLIHRSFLLKNGVIIKPETHFLAPGKSVWYGINLALITQNIVFFDIKTK